MKIMKKVEISNEEQEQFVSRLHKDYLLHEVDTPQGLDERVKALAVEVALRMKTASGFEEFLVLAAAEDSSTSTRRLVSKSGDLTLWVYVDEDNKDQGTVVVEIHPDRLVSWQGRHVVVRIGDIVVLRADVGDALELEADICFSEIDLTDAWQVTW